MPNSENNPFLAPSFSVFRTVEPSSLLLRIENLEKELKTAKEELARTKLSMANLGVLPYVINSVTFVKGANQTPDRWNLSLTSCLETNHSLLWIISDKTATNLCIPGTKVELSLRTVE